MIYTEWAWCYTMHVTISKGQLSVSGKVSILTNLESTLSVYRFLGFHEMSFLEPWFQGTFIGIV